MGCEEIKLWAVRPLKIDLVTGDTTLAVKPDGDSILNDIELPFSPKDNIITMVICDYGEAPFKDMITTLFITTKEDHSVDHVSLILQKKLNDLQLRRRDLFCSFAKGFIEVIKPNLKPVPNSNVLSYCILDNL